MGEKLESWVERDLTSTSATLAPAFAVDDDLVRVREALAAGRFPVLLGDPGVGKTAVVHELVRREAAGETSFFAGRRVVEISIRARLTALAQPNDIGKVFHGLVTLLVDEHPDVVPFFRDLTLAATYGLGPQLEMLGARFRGPILGEGAPTAIRDMFENSPELERRWLAIDVSEPDAGRTARIVSSWCAAETARGGKAFTEEAQRAALEVTSRFLARPCQPRKVLEVLGALGVVDAATRTVSAGDLFAYFERTYRVPRSLVDPAIPFDVEGTERRFRAQVLGQDEAARAVVQRVSLIKAALSDARRSFGAFLFVGPTGVGKTHLAQLLAEFLFGSRERLVRFNMADFQNPGDATMLFGDPEGYRLVDRQGILTRRISRHPFAVLLFDELEKANATVHDRFFQLLDEGQFINGDGETVSCRSMILIATSNAGAEVYRAAPLGFGTKPDRERLDRELDRLLYQHFRFELLNRFDHVVHFRPLGREEVRSIALREVEALRDRSGIRDRGLVLEVDEAVLDWLVAHGYDPHFGARFLKRTIERHVTTALAEVIVREPLEPGTHLRLGVRAGGVRASVIERVVEPTAPVRLPEGKGARAKSLDKKALVKEGTAIVERARPLFAKLEEERARAARSLERMSDSALWNDRVEAGEILAEHRRADVWVQRGERLAAPIEQLAIAVGAERERTKTEVLGRLLERAASSLRDWEDQATIAGPSRVYLVLRALDPSSPPGEWLDELARMYLAWCRHLDLDVEIVGFAVDESELTHVVLEAEGLGAETYLAMEHGVHRLARAELPDLRVHVGVVSPAPASHAEEVRRPKREQQAVKGPLGIEPRGLLRIALEGGRVLELLGPDPEALVRFARDAGHAWGEADGDVARLYAHAGLGAKDPRTKATVARYRDVVRGRLDPLLEGWKRRA